MTQDESFFFKYIPKITVFRFFSQSSNLTSLKMDLGGESVAYAGKMVKPVELGDLGLHINKVFSETRIINA